MYRLIIALLLIFTLGLSCQSKNSSFGTSSPQTLGPKLSFTLDTLTLCKGKVKKYQFGNYSTSFILDKKSYILFEDFSNSNTIIINQDNDSIITYEIDSSINMNQPHNYYFQSIEKYYLLTDDGVLFEVIKGKLQNQIDLNQLEVLVNAGMSIHSVLNSHNNPFLSSNYDFYFPIHQNPFLKGEFTNKNYDFPITARYNLVSKKVEFIGPTFPKYLYKNNFGLLNKEYQYYTDSSIFYAFDGVPEIWEYKILCDTLLRYSVKSSQQSESIETIKFKSTPKTKDLLFKHLMASDSYQRLIYDPFKDCYYRFYYHRMEEKNQNGEFNSYKDKRISLLVLNKAFEIRGEFLLPKECFFIFIAAPAKNGLYINFGPINNNADDEIKLAKINFN